MNSTTIIHIVSEQRMQNLLPLLALNPARVIQICSNDAKFLTAAAHTAAAAKEAGLTAIFENHEIANSSPSIEDMRHAVKHLVANFPGAIVNITGGTKLMSLGAYLGASEFLDSPILYCDTANRRFMPVDKKALPAQMLSFDEVAKLLTVPIVMVTQGKNFRDDTITAVLLDFGREAWRLRAENHEAISTWTGSIRSALPRDANGRIEKDKQVLSRFLTLPLPFPQSDAAGDYLDAAVQAGLLSVSVTGSVHMIAAPKKSAIEFVSNLLDGAWLELAVAAAAMSGARYSDVRWSVQPTNQVGEDYGETDLLVVDLDRLNLAVISCKTSTHHVSRLEHLSSWRDRARALGGLHATGHICLFRTKNATEEADLQKIAKNMGLSVHVGDAMLEHFSQK